MHDGEPLEHFRREIAAVDKPYTITDRFKVLTKHKEHIGLLPDVFGGMDGIITIGDVTETLLGMKIEDEIDMRELAIN